MRQRRKGAPRQAQRDALMLIVQYCEPVVQQQVAVVTASIAVEHFSATRVARRGGGGEEAESAVALRVKVVLRRHIRVVEEICERDEGGPIETSAEGARLIIIKNIIKLSEELSHMI